MTESAKLEPDYIEISKQGSIHNENPEVKLLVIDWVNTVFSRRQAKTYFARPYFDTFLEYICQQFEVIIWSSATGNVFKAMCKQFPKVLKIYDGQYNPSGTILSEGRSCTIKDLKFIWSSTHYDATNTVLITDNPAVVPRQPYNVIRVSAYDSMSNNGDNTLLKLIKYLTYLRHQSNVVNYIMNFPFDEKRDWNIVSDPARDRMLTQFTKNGDPVTNKQKQKKENKAQKKANQSQQQVNSKTQTNNAQPQETSCKVKKRGADSDPGPNKKLKSPSGIDTKAAQVGQTSSNTANVSQKVKQEQQKREEQRRREDQRRREEQKKKDEQRRREEQKKADQRRREEQRKKEQKQKERQNKQNDTHEADGMNYERSPLISQRELKEIVDKFTESICAEIAAMDARNIM
ncbi:hypothetical protein G6F70_006490 [Rhizopus microsporus]|uniref:Mitochondrial import inner membrane translocase subunit TIM50 n=2 Tax=Rhizopus TaxID=4842 RepID=A0A367JHH8_RHIAZ|nr:hypothetical protein G6F71_006386 [Rhizopus microsporus]RCH89377.1 hypothetical protein CU097_007114 [Rhizopus azygosporus]KAG1197596.1 hypothetical protein G6F70_006490 [Rhizopus microsporus]KAG1209371.1 hypothetical protein G6F69_006411 [Rhizopus microsporus]KAG1230861.1 hypothetical protein G6F67_006173 [Rhizopus microsporus]